MYDGAVAHPHSLKCTAYAESCTCMADGCYSGKPVQDQMLAATKITCWGSVQTPLRTKVVGADRDLEAVLCRLVLRHKLARVVDQAVQRLLAGREVCRKLVHRPASQGSVAQGTMLPLRAEGVWSAGIHLCKHNTQPLGWFAQLDVQSIIMTSLAGQVGAMEGARRDKATHLSEARSRCCTSTLPPPFTASTAFLMLAAALHSNQHHMLNDVLRLKAADMDTLG